MQPSIMICSTQKWAAFQNLNISITISLWQVRVIFYFTNGEIKVNWLSFIILSSWTCQDLTPAIKMRDNWLKRGIPEYLCVSKSNWQIRMFSFGILKAILNDYLIFFPLQGKQWNKKLDSAPWRKTFGNPGCWAGQFFRPPNQSNKKDIFSTYQFKLINFCFPNPFISLSQFRHVYSVFLPKWDPK